MITIIISALVTLGILLGFSIWGLLHQCPPNQVLIFSGSRSRVGDRSFGYRIIKGGLGVRKPFIERVDSMDLTNMIIELSAHNAYAKGGVPVNVLGVANVKIAGHEPLLNNAIERFLGKSRAEIAAIAKATLEGSLRGVLATLTPEQLNEDRALLDERLAAEADQDMTVLGLVIDTLKIQNITDDVKYMDSIGRIRNADLISQARIAEAIARADAAINAANNSEREAEAQITAQIAIAQADGDRALQDAITRRAAVVAEEQASVAAMVAKAEADVAVQKARIEQVRSQLEADVVATARAQCEAMEQAAKAEVAGIIEDGKAKAEALTRLSASWNLAGDQAREIFLLQKMDSIIGQITDTIGETQIEKITVIDQKQSSGGLDAGRLIGLATQLKEVFGVDVVGKLQEMTSTAPSPAPASEPISREEVITVQEVVPPPMQRRSD